MRVAATNGDETWLYQFPEPLWKDAVKRIMSDMKAKKIPEEAAGGMLELIAEGIADAD